MLVSVVVPVYGVERFVARCIESLLAQTWQDLEIIVVDDCSTDNSLEIITSIIARQPDCCKHVKILRHNVNKGLPAARNTGMEVASGEYLFHCDGDDYVEPEMIERMMSVAQRSKADIVYCDWWLAYDKDRRYMRQPLCGTPAEALRAIMEGRMKYNVWNKLVRRRLYTDNHISFPAGYGMGEDMTMIRLFAVAESVAYIPEALYNYVKTNSGAMTETMSADALKQVCHNVDNTLSYLENRLADFERLSSLFKLSVKYPLLFSKDVEQYKAWNALYKEADIYAGNCVFGLRTRIVQKLAAHKSYRWLKLHYMLHAALYNMLYKT